jgi:hypothetical protein
MVVVVQERDFRTTARGKDVASLIRTVNSLPLPYASDRPVAAEPALVSVETLAFLIQAASSLARNKAVPFCNGG